MSVLQLDHGKADSPGLLVSVRDQGQPLQHWASGFADVQQGVLIRPEQRFRCGLITRTFAAAILLKLADLNVIKLDQPLEQLARVHQQDRGLLHILVTEYPMLRPITVRNLLSNTSGLPAFDKTVAYNEIFMKKPRKVWQIENYLDAITGVGARFQYGYRATKRGYFKDSGTNFIMASLVIEAVTGMKTSENMQQLFRDYALHDTQYLANGVMPADVLPSMLRGYLPLSHPYAGAFANVPVQTYNHNKELKVVDVTMAYTVNGMSNAASISNAIDLVRWFEMLVTGNVVAQHHAQLMQTTPLQPDLRVQEDYYCLSFYKSAHREWGDVLWTAGNSLGYSALLGHFVDKKRTFLLLSNVSRLHFSLYTEQLVQPIIQQIFNL